MQPVVLRSVGSDCFFDASPIVPGNALPRPLATSSAATDGFPGAVIVLADVKTWYIKWTGSTFGALNMHAELNGDGCVVGERLTVLPTVADFEAALGAIERDDLLDAAAGGDRWWPNNRGESGRPAPTLLPGNAVLAGISILAATRDSGRSDEQATTGPHRHRAGGIEGRMKRRRGYALGIVLLLSLLMSALLTTMFMRLSALFHRPPADECTEHSHPEGCEWRPTSTPKRQRCRGGPSSCRRPGCADGGAGGWPLTSKRCASSDDACP